ncbi:MAG: flagellar basal body protein [Candidatus Saganbacteria bacterium]|nr:flagellar basal body protein [Candidatus Saganbacteria bacterium]
MAEEIGLRIFDDTFLNLQKAMHVASKRQTVIAQNIANADTPGYVALEFDEVLDKAVKRAGAKNVVLEEEMASLSDNSIKYSAYVKLLSSKINILRNVASQGKR